MERDFSSTLRNLKFMKPKEDEKRKDRAERTFSYYAAKNILRTFSAQKKPPARNA